MDSAEYAQGHAFGWLQQLDEQSRRQTESSPASPHLIYERGLWRQGYRSIAGIDEAGRGALAGPVVAAAVVLPGECTLDGIWSEMRDSKLLAPDKRVELDAAIRTEAAGWGIGAATAQEIDDMGIAPATRLAMMRALDGIDARCGADFLLIDWVRLNRCPLPQHSFARADRISVSVAAASILAKVARDRYMIELSEQYPDYRFASNKGYGAKIHLDALARVGPCTEHRHSFRPIARQAALLEMEGSTRAAACNVDLAPVENSGVKNSGLENSEVVEQNDG